MPGYLVKCYSRCVLRVFLDEINIWMSGLSKVALPSVGGWPSFSQWKARMPSTKRGTLHPKKRGLLLPDRFELECQTYLAFGIKLKYPLLTGLTLLAFGLEFISSISSAWPESTIVYRWQILGLLNLHIQFLRINLFVYVHAYLNIIYIYINTFVCFIIYYIL